MISPHFIPYHPFTKPGSHYIPIKISPYILIKIQILVKSSSFSILTSPKKKFGDSLATEVRAHVPRPQLGHPLCAADDWSTCDLYESLHRSRTERRRGEPREPMAFYISRMVKTKNGTYINDHKQHQIPVFFSLLRTSNLSFFVLICLHSRSNIHATCP